MRRTRSLGARRTWLAWPPGVGVPGEDSHAGRPARQPVAVRAVAQDPAQVRHLRSGVNLTLGVHGGALVAVAQVLDPRQGAFVDGPADGVLHLPAPLSRAGQRVKAEYALVWPAAWALGLAASITVASSRMTSTGCGHPPGSVTGRVNSLPATRTGGSCPCRTTIASHSLTRGGAHSLGHLVEHPQQRGVRGPAPGTEDLLLGGHRLDVGQARRPGRQGARRIHQRPTPMPERDNPARATTSVKPVVTPSRSASNRGSTTPA
jgi:hypothetical protein